MSRLRVLVVLIVLVVIAILFTSRREHQVKKLVPEEAQTNAEAAKVKSSVVRKTPSVPPAKSTVTPPPAENPEVPKEVQRLRNEAKASLAGAFSSLRAFHSEYERYSTDFWAIGFKPSAIEEKKPLDFKMGFLTQYDPEQPLNSEVPAAMITDTYMRVNENITNPNRDRPSYSDAAKEISLDNYRRYCQMGCTADRDRFEMILVVPVGEGRNDVWLINDKKELVQACDGLKEKC